MTSNQSSVTACKGPQIAAHHFQIGLTIYFMVAENVPDHYEQLSSNGSIALFGGHQLSFGGFLSGGFTWEASTKDYMKAWSWVDDEIPNFGFPTIS